MRSKQVKTGKKGCYELVPEFQARAAARDTIARITAAAEFMRRGQLLDIYGMEDMSLQKQIVCVYQTSKT
jgi:hypothetical protein